MGEEIEEPVKVAEEGGENDKEAEEGDSGAECSQRREHFESKFSHGGEKTAISEKSAGWVR